MSAPGAKQGDRVVALDTHIIMMPSPAGPVPTPMCLPFSGEVLECLAGSVFIDDKAAAVEGSVATNSPAHVPPGGSWQKPPSNKGKVSSGSGSVFVENKSAARAGDTVETCNDPQDAPNGVLVAVSTVFIGG